MHSKYRFIGIRPFKKNENNLFFERENITEKILKSLYFNQITLIHSKAGYGKTSIINAGILPKLEEKQNLIFFYISIPNFIKNSKCNLSEILFKKIDNKIPKNSYLDKVITPENSLWYKLKRIESIENTEIIIILDQFENIFSFSETEISKFKDELVKALYEQIPENLRTKIDKKLAENKNLLTNQGIKKLYKNISLKLLISTRSDKIHKLDFFTDKIRNLTKNSIEIPPITPQQAKNILTKTASFKPKYNIDDNFLSHPFEITNELQSEIIDFLTNKGKNPVETYQLQIIGLEIEKIATKLMINKIGKAQISDFKGLYNDYYQAVINKIQDNIQRVSARKFIEDELIFEYEHRKLTVYQGIAKQKYKLNDDTLNLLIDNNIISKIKNKNNEIFYEISHDALITPILIAKEKRIKYEIEIENELKQKKFLELQAQRQKQKIIRIRRTAIILTLFVTIISIFSLIIFYQRNKAIENQKIASSNMYVAYALNYLQQDPTKSYRLAQKAFKIAPYNQIAQNTLIKSFYETNIFYGNVIKTGMPFDDAIFSHNCNNALLIKNTDKDDLLIALINKKGEISPLITPKSYISSINFSADDKKIIIAYYAGYAVLYDTKGKEICRYNHGGIVNFATISNDNSLVATCGNDKTTKIWSIDGKLLTTLHGHSEAVKYANFSNDNKKIVTSANDFSIIVYNTNGKIIAKYYYPKEYEFQNNEIQPVKFSPDDKKILFVVNDFLHFNFQIDIWDYANNKITKKFKNFSDWINTSYFADNQIIIATTKNNEAYIINTNNDEIKRLAGHTGSVCDARFNTDDDLIYTISTDQTIRTWKIYNLNILFDNFTGLEFLNFSETAKYFAFQKNDTLKIYDFTGKNILNINKKINNLKFSANDKFIVITDNQGICYLINTQNGFTQKLKEKIIAILADENKILIADSNNIYSFDYNAQLIENQKLTEKFDKIYLSENYIILVKKNSILLFDEQLNFLKKTEIANIRDIKFSNQQFIVETERKLYLLNYNLDKISEISVNQPISASNISQNGTFKAIATNKGLFSIYDKNNNEILSENFYNQVTKIVFSSDEKNVIVQYFTNDFKLMTKIFLLSPQEIVRYTDDLKLYGSIWQEF